MWLIKATVQLALSLVPGGEHTNHFLQRIRQRKAGRRRKTAHRAPRIADAIGRIDRHIDLNGARVVEVGTGWCPVPALLLSLVGAEVVTYDHVRHVRLSLIHEALDVFLEQKITLASALGRDVHAIERDIHSLRSCDTLDDLFTRAKISYRAPADATRTGLVAGSMDLFYSHAVLEHVPRAVVTALLAEARRILRPGGLFYALVGLHDHYAPFGVSRVNFLRYSDHFWRLIAQNSISYQNRMREPEYLREIESGGGVVVALARQLQAEDVEAVRRMRVAPRFASFTPEELAVTELEVLARLQHTS